jgi:hypothetical protein
MEDRSKLADWILDQVADAVICANRSGAIIRWNRASTALFGYSAEEALDQSIDLIIPEHLRTAHWSGFEAPKIFHSPGPDDFQVSSLASYNAIFWPSGRACDGATSSHSAAAQRRHGRLGHGRSSRADAGDRISQQRG